MICIFFLPPSSQQYNQARPEEILKDGGGGGLVWKGEGVDEAKTFMIQTCSLHCRPRTKSHPHPSLSRRVVPLSGCRARQ